MAGRHRLQAGSPHAVLPAGPSCTPSPPVSCCYTWDTDKLLVLLLFGPGLNLPRLPPAQGFTASPAWTAELLTPHCCSSCSSVSPAATMPCSHLRGSRQLPPTRSFSCPDAPGDLSQVPPLGWKNPRPGSCKASSKPHTADQVGTSFPWLQQEQGARGFAAKPGLSASWCPQG